MTLLVEATERSLNDDLFDAAIEWGQRLAWFERDAIERVTEAARSELHRALPIEPKGRQRFTSIVKHAVKAGLSVLEPLLREVAYLAPTEKLAPLAAVFPSEVDEGLEERVDPKTQKKRTKGRYQAGGLRGHSFTPTSRKDANALVKRLTASDSWAANVSGLVKYQNMKAGQVLAKGIADAQTPGQIRRTLIDKLGSDKNWNMFTRTELQRVNNLSQQDAYEKNRDLLAGQQYSAALDTHTCMVCAGDDGNSYWYSPGPGQRGMNGQPALPRHANCLLPGARVSTGHTIATFAAFYDGPAVRLIMASGTTLAVTAQHKLLTPRGLVAADLLQSGDNLVCRAAAKGEVSTNPNNNYTETLIEEIVGTSAESPSMGAVCVPAAAEYLHGDGRYIDGDINIVWPDGLLGCASKPASAQHSEELFLDGGALESALAADGDFRAMLRCLGFAAQGRVSSAGQTQPLSFAGVSHAGEHGFTSITRGITGQNHVLTQTGPTYAEPLAGLLERFASLVATNQIVDIKRFRYRGHVYDLQTESGVYIANGLVSSNCRCNYNAITKGWDELGIAKTDVPPALDGKPPQHTRYSDWLARQADAIQLAALGGKRYQLYKSGVPVSGFSAAGKTLPLSALTAPGGATLAPVTVAAKRSAMTALDVAATGLQPGRIADIGQRANLMTSQIGVEINTSSAEASRLARVVMPSEPPIVPPKPVMPSITKMPAKTIDEATAALEAQLNTRIQVVGYEGATQAEQAALRRYLNAIGSEASQMRQAFPTIDRLISRQVARIDTMSLHKGAEITKGVRYRGTIGQWTPKTKRMDLATGQRALQSQNVSIGGWTGESANETFRHEMGHRFKFLADSDAWKKTWKGHSKGWWQKNVSGYGSASREEAWAETFRIYTHPRYGKTGQARLAKELEDIMSKAIGKHPNL